MAIPQHRIETEWIHLIDPLTPAFNRCKHLGFAVAENAQKAENTQVGVRYQDVQGVQHKFLESNTANST